VCAALADDDRLRLFGRISQDRAGVRVADLGLDRRGLKALERLLRTGLVDRAGDCYVVRPEAFRLAAEDQASSAAADGVSARVAALFSGSKLTFMPRAGALRTELLRYLVERFRRDRAYSEKEIRDGLQPAYSDHAALRRYMVDEGILARDNLGTYWRPD
jgi:hypothetical protein